MNEKLQLESTIHFKRLNRGEKVIRTGEAPPEPLGRVPRISRMMALAVWFDKLIRKGEVKNFAELAELGQVCRTRVTNIMNLLLLAPDIQEEILFLPRIAKGPDALRLKGMQEVAKKPNWIDQRRQRRRCLRQSRDDWNRRIAKLMALAMHLAQLLRDGKVKIYPLTVGPQEQNRLLNIWSQLRMWCQQLHR